MPGPSEPQSRPLRAAGSRRRARLGHHRDHLLAGLAAADLTLAVLALVALADRAGGILLALFIASVAGAYAIETTA